MSDGHAGGTAKRARREWALIGSTILLSLVAKMQSVRKEDIRPDGMVQWDKFMRFGEILAIIPKCQARGAIVLGQPSKAFMTILHNVPVIHDEDVSQQVLYPSSR